MNIIHDDDTLRIFYEAGEGDTTLITFSGIDFDTFGFNSVNPEAIDRPEFVKVTQGMGDRFWIVDKKRAWGSTIDWEWTSNFLSPKFDGKRVIALGNCMGGTNAIKFAYHADVHRVIAFTPHWSVDPDIMQEHQFDPRTKPLRELTLSMGWKSLEGMFRPMTEYIHLWTPDEIDILHMIKFPTLPNIKRIFFPTSNHSLARTLKNFGVLTEVLDQCIISEDVHKEVSKILDEAGIIHELF